MNAASRVQHQARGDQVLITDALLEAARTAGFECARMGRAELKGKDEPIDLYVVAWSQSATQQLVTEVQTQYEQKVRELKRRVGELEEEFEHARDQWRDERRNLNRQIEQLEEAGERARIIARQQVSEDMHAELRFELEETNLARQQAEEDLASANQKFDAEKNNLKAQMASMQASVIEAMERSNNPARMAMAVREQVEERVAEAKQEWQLQWDAERKRLSSKSSVSKKVRAERRSMKRRTLHGTRFSRSSASCRRVPSEPRASGKGYTRTPRSSGKPSGVSSTSRFRNSK